ncbi:MAG TPA: cation diffusion facilitator family transporter [Spirochaetota bacterium]|nr:cation diffusion facilitator family transporter [Spirochaetota bacterium]HPJ40026.1 cation diffusion facilitator family transporter [Spirochaetota bacterium]
MENTTATNINEHGNDRKNFFAVNLGLGANVVLAFFKVAFGILGHSPALLADGINSTSDVVYYIAAKIFLRISIEPADEEHPYGHRQMENIAAIVVGSFIVTTAVAIFWNSIDLVYDIIIRHQQSMQAARITLIIALATILIKLLLTYITKKIGKKTNNSAVRALAYDHLNDVFASTAAAVGIFFSLRGYFWVDPFAGCVVAVFILKTGIEIIKESAYGLMASAPDPALLREIEGHALGVEGITGVDNVRIHSFGQFMVVNMDIALKGTVSIQKGDELADILESILLKNINDLMEVHIHYHPENRGGCVPPR